MKTGPITVYLRSRASRALSACFICVICVICGSGALSLLTAQNPQHNGIEVEGYTTAVTPNSITVFDKKKREIKIMTDKDYTSIVGIAEAVTVWYTTQGGTRRLEDIEITQRETYAPEDLSRVNIKRIAIWPRPEDVENSQGLINAISKYLADNAGWFVAPPELSLEIASHTTASASPLDAIDPNTGDVDMKRYLQSQQSLVMTIAQETHSNAVLEVRVIKVKAEVRALVASWDDMTEPVGSRKSRVLSPFGGIEDKGWVYAATADMYLWSPVGKLLWRKRRGFAVLGVKPTVGSKFRERPLTEVYQNSEVMQRWLEGTLGQLAPSAKATPAGSSQLSPELPRPLQAAQ